MYKIKYCKFCDKEKPEEDFCKSGGYIKNICRDCQNKKQKKIYQNSKRTKQLEQEIERLNNIINKVYKYLDEKKDVPEWWDTDFMICMDILKDGTGYLKDILGSDK